MDSFDELCRVFDTLLGPEGCPWDKEQTLGSLREHLLEEAYEVVEAIDSGDIEHIKEELGDLIGMTVLLSKIAEKKESFCVQDACRSISQKLIRRHPHIFGSKENLSADEVLIRWDEMKDREHAGKRKSALDSLPKTLPALQRAQEVIRKIKKAGFRDIGEEDNSFEGKLFSLVEEAEDKGMNIELEFMRYLRNLEACFREKESSLP